MITFREHSRGKHPRMKPSAAAGNGRHTENKYRSRVSEVVEAFLQELAATGSPSDIVFEQHSILAQFELNVRDCALSRVNEHQLSDMIRLRNCGRESQRHIRALFDRLFSWAQARGYIPADQPTAAERLDRLYGPVGGQK